MIFGTTAPPLAAAPLQRIDLPFHLTGSRVFGNHQEGSDWDFFTEDVSGLADWLERRGFVCLGRDAQYNDRELVAVWRKGNVDVQVVKSIPRKLRAQSTILAHFMPVYTKLPKEARSTLWNAILEDENV